MSTSSIGSPKATRYQKPPDFTAWASAYCHHDAIDAGELAALEQQLAAIRAAQAAHP